MTVARQRHRAASRMEQQRKLLFGPIPCGPLLQCRVCGIRYLGRDEVGHGDRCPQKRVAPRA